MTESSAKGKPNPFYVLLMVVSTVFVITSLAYLVGPTIEQQTREDAQAAAGMPHSQPLVVWLDHHGPTALAFEFGAMLVLGVMAMATEHWYSPGKPSRAPRKNAETSN